MREAIFYSCADSGLIVVICDFRDSELRFLASFQREVDCVVRLKAVIDSAARKEPDIVGLRGSIDGSALNERIERQGDHGRALLFGRGSGLNLESPSAA